MIARRFRAAIIMPNLKPPVTTFTHLEQYKEIIHRANTTGHLFTPMMTLYLTDNLNPGEVDLCGHHAVKYYPRGLTTNSADGVENPQALWSKGSKPHQVLRLLASTGKVLILHAADGFAREGVIVRGTQYHADEELDPYDQEPHFMRETLPRIIDAHPELKIEVAHLSTKEGAEFMQKNGGKRLGCSITCHHLLNDRRDVMRGGFRPHLDWRPVIQPKDNTQALQELCFSGHPFVWLGMDSAPHPRKVKEAACCATGVLTAHAGIELYAEAFETFGALDQRFENFASNNAANFYGLADTDTTITLVNKPWKVRGSYLSGNPDEEIIPYRLGEEVLWRLVE